MQLLITQELTHHPVYIDSISFGLPPSVQVISEAGLYKLAIEPVSEEGVRK